jgi:hypothetical protein
MPEDKYAALVMEHSLELLKKLFQDQDNHSFFISNRTLYELFDRVQTHFGRAFREDLELVTLRRLRNKAEGFRQDLLRPSQPYDYVEDRRGERVPVIPEEAGKKALETWCQIPDFED